MKKEIREINLDRDKNKEIVGIFSFQDLDRWERGGIIVVDDNGEILYKNPEIWEFGYENVYFVDFDKDGNKEIVVNYMYGSAGCQSGKIIVLKRDNKEYKQIFEIEATKTIFENKKIYALETIDGLACCVARDGFNDIGGFTIKPTRDKAFILNDKGIVYIFDEWVKAYVWKDYGFVKTKITKEEEQRIRKKYDKRYLELLQEEK